jgi:predicted dehydrogenase
MERRSFLTSAATGFALTTLPDWFSARAEAAEVEAQAARPRRIAANDKIRIGLIGAGGSKGGFRQGLGDARNIASRPGVECVAVCDVDLKHLQEASEVFEGSKKYVDFRYLLDRSDIDAVVIGTPDHWHAVIAGMAMRKGKDVYCEKPMTLTIGEGTQLVKLAKETGAVWQTGSQQRSDARFRLACELVRNGRIGQVKKVTAHLPGGSRGTNFQITDAPDDFMFDMWLGPAPETPYIKERTHGSFRHWFDYSGGMMTDWGAHHLDISQWGLGMDKSGPVKVKSKGTAQPADAEKRSFEAFLEYEVTYTYANGVELTATDKGENGVTFEGEDGRWIFVSRGRIAASDPKLLTDPLPEKAERLYVSDNHAQNFVDGIRTRKQPICNVEVGHRSASVCHLGNISLRLGGRELNWDPKKEVFKDDAEANGMINRKMRGGWTI